MARPVRAVSNLSSRVDALSSEMASKIDVAGAPDRQGRGPDVAFLLWGGAGGLTARGILRELEPTSADRLASRVADFFARHKDGPRVLVGALPFERDRPGRLFQPVRIGADQPFTGPAGPMPGGWAIRAEPDVAAFRQEVAEALDLIARSPETLSKVVLSRSLALTADGPVDPLGLAARLAGDPTATCFMAPVGADGAGQTRRLVGATPELLISKAGSTAISHPLAGSARRGRTAAEDQALAEGLMASEKDRREHTWVVEAILDTLAPYCAELSAGDPSLVSTRTMWHLGTRIEGRLKDPSTPSIELASALHPTPAVGGYPREAAYEAIHRIETYDRGFYAGAVGWTDAKGDGDWYVALRCAEVCGPSVRLYAGAGIVAGSDPEAEAAETSAKFQTLLSALGVDENGRATRQTAK